MSPDCSPRDQTLRVFLEHFPGAVVVDKPDLIEGPWGRGEEGWRNWLMENLDRQFAEYRAAGGADSLPPNPEKAVRAEADCPLARVLLIRCGERVLMYSLAGRKRRRVRPFATPYMAHAMRQAEAWFGEPVEGWKLKFRSPAKGKGGQNLWLQSPETAARVSRTRPQNSRPDMRAEAQA